MSSTQSAQRAFADARPPLGGWCAAFRTVINSLVYHLRSSLSNAGSVPAGVSPGAITPSPKPSGEPSPGVRVRLIADSGIPWTPCPNSDRTPPAPAGLAPAPTGPVAGNSAHLPSIRLVAGLQPNSSTIDGNQSQDSASRRPRGNRSGGRNRNRQGNQTQKGGNPSEGRGRSRNRSSGRSGPRSSQSPKQTLGQKILSILTFGLLGKPKSKRQAKLDRKPEASKSSRPAPRPVKDRSSSDESGKPKRARTEVTSGRLYVGNLDYTTGESELEELFRGVGNVLRAEVVTNPRTQQSKGFAFVEMGSIDEARRAVSILDDQDFMGRRLIVNGARSEGPNEEGGETAFAGSSSEGHA